MLQLVDQFTGRRGEVRPARRGELRVYLAAAVSPRALDADDLRACLVADLVRRVADHHHLRVSAWQQAAGGGQAAMAGPAAARAAAEIWDALNVYPLELSGQVPAPLDVRVIPATGQVPGPGRAAEPQPAGSAGTRWLRPAPVTSGADLSPDGIRAAHLDPLALRLAFLGRHYTQPVGLSQAGLAASDSELRNWRAQVAGWARSPSKPMCAQYVQDFLAAFDRDLDTGTALATLRALAGDTAIPAGSKFETFAYLDRLLGLDLARDVGRA